ncbi:MAG: zinc transporter ZntB [Myxococcales bacterium]|nr:zinc transporter ZntB [Myxococcales bacterium]HRC58894.1 zinc transporter ZntB [Kofleriaceae bacterium]
MGEDALPPHQGVAANDEGAGKVLASGMGPGLVYAFLLDGRGGAQTLTWEAVRAWRPEQGVLWVHLDYSHEVVARWLAERSSLDETSREALLDHDPRPSVSMHDDGVLLILRGINLNQGAEPEDMVSLRVWAQGERVITLRRRSVRVLREVALALVRGTGARTAGELLVELVSKILDPAVKCVATLDDEIDACEEQALAEQTPDLRARLTAYRRTSVMLRRFLAPQREAWSRLPQLAVPWLTEDDRESLALAADRLARSFEELEAARDRAAVTHEELSSRVGELTNKRLYLLSVITAVFLPLGFVTSLLGVNVGGVPGSSTSWGFWLLCSLFAIGVVAQLRFFKWRGWL